MPIALAIAGLVVLAVVVVIGALRRSEITRATGVLSFETKRRDRGRRLEAPVPTGRELELAARNARRSTEMEVGRPASAATWVRPDREVLGATRRQFLNRSIVGFFTVGLSGFGAALIAFLWPQSSGGFGSAIRVGDVSQIVQDIRSNNGFLYKPEGRMWLTEYPANALDKARSVYSAPELAGMEAGVVALYQKCPHLGCRVPECETSQWFECQCHGSQYNRVGEKKGGPAPRGMDRFAMQVSNGALTVDTGTIILGPAIGTNTTGQEAEGPHCAGAADH